MVLVLAQPFHAQTIVPVMVSAATVNVNACKVSLEVTAVLVLAVENVVQRKIHMENVIQLVKTFSNVNAKLVSLVTTVP